MRQCGPARWRLRRVAADCGPFGPAYDALWQRDVPEVLRVAIGREIDWFERNLPVPKPRRDAFCSLSQERHLEVATNCTGREEVARSTKGSAMDMLTKL